MFGKRGAATWLALVLGLLVISGLAIHRSWRVESNILALLPSDEQDPALSGLLDMIAGQSGRVALALVAHPDPEAGRDAATRLGELMRRSPLLSSVRWDYRDQEAAFFEFYFPRRYQLLPETLRRRLQDSPDFTPLFRHIRARLYGPTSALYTRFLASDPLLVFPERLAAWSRESGALELRRGYSVSPESKDASETRRTVYLGRELDGISYVLVTATLAFDPFDPRGGERLAASWQDWRQEVAAAVPGAQLSLTSTARFAHHIRRSMERDMSFIGLGSLAGVIALLLFAFGSLRHLLLSLVPIAVALGISVGLTVLCFGGIHVFTLVLGASLIGVCIDYSFHYFAHHRTTPRWHPRRAMRAIAPALGLGALTTLMSYASLSFAPLTGLRQVAVFSGVGIVISLGVVVFWFPLLLSERHRAADREALFGSPIRSLLALHHRRPTAGVVVVAVLTIAAAVGVARVRIDDSPRALNPLPAQLAAEDRAIRRVLGASGDQKYLVVEGGSVEETLQRLERLHAVVTGEEGSRWADTGPFLTSYLPSRARQLADLALIERALADRDAVARALDEMGFDPAGLDPVRALVDRGDRGHRPDRGDRGHRGQRDDRGLDLIELDEWLASPVSAGLRNLWLGATRRGFGAIVQVEAVHDREALTGALAGLPGTYYSDQVSAFSAVLARYREASFILVGLAYAAILGLLALRYRRHALRLFVPPLVAAGMAVGALGWLGLPFHLMHSLALILVLGMGIDYTIFFAESDESSRSTTLFALTLSALTTILGFGLLALSSQASLRAIGIIASVGISFAWLLAPVAQRPRAQPRAAQRSAAQPPRAPRPSPQPPSAPRRSPR